MDQYNFGSDSDTDSDFNGFSPHDIHHPDNSTIDNIDSVSENSSVSSNESSDEDLSSDNLEDQEPRDFQENPPSWCDQNLKDYHAPSANLQDGPRLPNGWDCYSQPIDYFKLFLTPEIIENIVKFTNSYASIAITKKQACVPRYTDKHWNLDGSNNIDEQELLAYLGCCAILSINPSHQLRYAFSSDPYLGNQGLCSVFPLKRFQKRSQFFSLCDKILEPDRMSPIYSRGYKVKMITDSLNVNFPKFYQISGYVCLDELTEACRACLSYVQFNPVKPIKRGLKIFSLCDSKSSDSCYLLQFEPYFGKCHTVVSRHGLYFDVVNRLTKLIRGHNVKLFCDNLYSSLPLFVHLKNQHQILATGTIHSNRIGLPPPVKNPGKMIRGEYKIFQDANDPSLTACVWQDTRQVWYISTAYSPNVAGAALR